MTSTSTHLSSLRRKYALLHAAFESQRASLAIARAENSALRSELLRLVAHVETMQQQIHYLQHAPARHPRRPLHVRRPRPSHIEEYRP
jgi:hypothetical protein